MRRYCLFASVAAVCQLILIAGGCGNCSWPGGGSNSHQSNGLSGVAVVDLDEVANQLGISAALKKQLSDGQSSLNQQLQTYQTTLQEKYRQKAQELASQPAAETQPDLQKKQLVGLEREMNLKLSEAKRTAQNEFGAYRQRLIQQFREEVVPVAQQAAAQRGLGVVITKNDTVLLAFDNAHDITAAVVAGLRAKQAALQGSANSAPADRTAATNAQRR